MSYSKTYYLHSKPAANYKAREVIVHKYGRNDNYGSNYGRGLSRYENRDRNVITTSILRQPRYEAPARESNTSWYSRRRDYTRETDVSWRTNYRTPVTRETNISYQTYGNGYSSRGDDYSRTRLHYSSRDTDYSRRSLQYREETRSPRRTERVEVYRIKDTPRREKPKIVDVDVGKWLHFKVKHAKR